jgi:ankyrin repeat protein
MDEIEKGICNHDIQKLTDLLESGVDLNEPIKILESVGEDFGKRPLLLAIEIGWTEGAEFLVNRGADVNSPGEDGQTALMMAADAGAADMVELLLEPGADYTLIDKYGNNALSLAYSGFYGPVITLLRRAGLTIPASSDLHISDLHLSAVEGDPVECERLIHSGVDPNVSCAYGLTPLHCAAHVGCIPVIQMLLDAGAEIDRRCDGFEDDMRLPGLGETALEHAIWGNQFEAVRFLLDAGADVYRRFFNGAGDGFSVLAWAAREGSWKEDTRILRLLLERGVRDDLREALGQAACWRFEEGVKLLLSYGAGANRDDLLFAMKRATEENGFSTIPILYEAGRRLDPPLTATEIMAYLDEVASQMAPVARRVMAEAGIHLTDTQEGRQ